MDSLGALALFVHPIWRCTKRGIQHSQEAPHGHPYCQTGRSVRGKARFMLCCDELMNVRGNCGGSPSCTDGWLKLEGGYETPKGPFEKPPPGMQSFHGRCLPVGTVTYHQQDLECRASMGASIDTCLDPLPKVEQCAQSEEGRVVPVDDVLFTQRCCSAKFRCGRPLQDTIHQLDSWMLDTLNTDWLKLEVICFRDRQGHKRIHSNDNRRLLCLKTHQQNVRRLGWKVYINVRYKKKK